MNKQSEVAKLQPSQQLQILDEVDPERAFNLRCQLKATKPSRRKSIRAEIRRIVEQIPQEQLSAALGEEL